MYLLTLCHIIFTVQLDALILPDSDSSERTI